MRPLLGGLAASLLLMWTAGAQAADTAAPTAQKPAATQAQLTPKVVAASLSPDWLLKATLYHAGAAGVGGRDSIGCAPVAMRTVATDPKLIPRRTVLFIAETVGLPLPGGGVHDGFWYASDVGGAIKGARIDLYTGQGKASMKPIFNLNLKKLTVARAGTFKGCPKAASQPTHGDMLMQLARRSGVLNPQFAVIDYVTDRLRGAAVPAPQR